MSRPCHPFGPRLTEEPCNFKPVSVHICTMGRKILPEGVKTSTSLWFLILLRPLPLSCPPQLAPKPSELVERQEEVPRQNSTPSPQCIVRKALHAGKNLVDSVLSQSHIILAMPVPAYSL